MKLLDENSAYKFDNKETSSEQFLLSFNIDNSDILRYVESFLSEFESLVAIFYFLTTYIVAPNHVPTSSKR